jgi:hypothetical protein
LDAHLKISGRSKWNHKEPFGLLDLVEMCDRVKNMDIMYSTQGNFYYFKSLQESDISIVTQMLEQVSIFARE